jgi:hypothetical protein
MQVRSLSASLSALKKALLGTVFLAPVTAFAAGPPTCAQLATNPAYGLAGNSYITATASDNQGIASPQAAIVPATATNAAYCLVQFQYSSESGPAFGYAVGESQTIGIAVGLPLNSTDGGVPTNPGGYTWTALNGAWNGKVQNLGGGGNIGTVGSVTSATNYGWVGSASDGGHNAGPSGNGTVGNFGVIQATHQLDYGKIRDFASESQHQQYLWALSLAKQYYSRPATRNYWNSCSTGGRQGLVLAQNWGADFDGILAGAPVIYNNSLDLGHAWPALVNRDDVVGKGGAAITTAQYNTAVAHAIAACDVEGSDVVADGVVDDPRQCKYTAEGDQTILAAPAGTCTGANCLDSLQAAALDKIWDGPRNHLGKRIWNPWLKVMPVGGFIDVGPMIPDTQNAEYWDHKDLTYDVQNLYSSRALASANPFGEPAPIALEDEWMLSEGPGGPENLLAGADYQGIIDNVYSGPKHGKLIMWQGGADPDVFWQDSIHYYRAVATTFGSGRTDFAGLQSWFRYYHAPGVGHCGGGVGASPVQVTLPDGNAQIFDDLVKWVEDGIVPQSAGDYTHEGILATGPGTFGTRPICPWPTTAIYNGTGSTAVASNYHCGGNLEAYPPTAATNHVATICQEPVTVYDQATSDKLDYQALGITVGQCPSGGDDRHYAGGDNPQ